MKKWFHLLIATNLLLVDQAVKYLSIKKPFPETEGFLINSCNPNIAWSIPINEIFFWIIWTGIILAILNYLIKSFDLFLLIVLFGAISNIIDRITRGCVVDYINFYSFPIFNIADIMITGGIIIFFLKDLFSQSRKKTKQ